MQTDWKVYYAKGYYLKPSGEMAANEWIGNYYVDSTGWYNDYCHWHIVWVDNGNGNEYCGSVNDDNGNTYDEDGNYIGNLFEWM